MNRILLLLLASACGTGPEPKATPSTPDPSIGPPVTDITSQAMGCYALHLYESGEDRGWLGLTETGTTMVSTLEDAARFTFQPADLGEYLLYDQDGLWLSAEDGPLTRSSVLQSDMEDIGAAHAVESRVRGVSKIFLGRSTCFNPPTILKHRRQRTRHANLCSRHAV